MNLPSDIRSLCVAAAAAFIFSAMAGVSAADGDKAWQKGEPSASLEDLDETAFLTAVERAVWKSF
jgi:hypothetical protein